MKSITTFKLLETAVTCGVEQNDIRQFIEEKWIEPFDRDHLNFDEEDVERIKLIVELQDMGVNNEAVPIILHLIDQLNHLRHGLQKNIQEKNIF